MKKFYVLSLIALFLNLSISFSQWTQGGSIRTSSCETLSNIRCFVADSVNLYVGANNVKCSTNNGKNWIEAGIVGFDFDEVKDLVYHNNLIYAATTQGLYISPGYDIGWADINSNLPTKRTNGILFSNNTLYCGTYDFGLFKSTNFGQYWIPANADSAVRYISTLAYYNDKLLIGTYYGLYISSDDGSSWIKSENGLTSSSIGTIKISGNSIFVGCFDGFVFKSTDGGDSWTKLTGLSTTKNEVYSLLPFGNFIFAGTDDGMYMSKDDGAKWSCINDFLPLQNLYELEMIVKDNKLIAGITPGNGGYQTIVSSPVTFFNIFIDLSVNGYTLACKEFPSEFSTKKETGVTINWSVENGSIIGSNTDSVVKVNWNTAGTGKVILTKENKTAKVKDSSYFLVQVDEKPAKPQITNIRDTLYSSAPVGNQWYFNGMQITGANGNMYIPSQDGDYSVDVYYHDFQSERSDSLLVIVSAVKESIENNYFVVSPNPANDYIIITLPSYAHTLKGVVEDVHIYDVFGQVYPTPALPASREGVRIDVSALPAGVYFVRVGDKVSKFVKI